MAEKTVRDLLDEAIRSNDTAFMTSTPPAGNVTESLKETNRLLRAIRDRFGGCVAAPPSAERPRVKDVSSFGHFGGKPVGTMAEWELMESLLSVCDCRLQPGSDTYFDLIPRDGTPPEFLASLQWISEQMAKGVAGNNPYHFGVAHAELVRLLSGK